MKYYIPSYKQTSRINFKRRRSKTPVLFGVLAFTAVLYLLLTGFNSLSTSTPDMTLLSQEENLNSTDKIPADHNLAADSSESVPQDNPPAPVPAEPPALNEPREASSPRFADFFTRSKPDANENQDTIPFEPDVLREEVTFAVASGDTLMRLLVREGLDNQEAHSVIRTLQDVFNPRRIRQGHEITLAFEIQDDCSTFESMNLKLGLTRSVQVARCSENGFVASEIVRELGSRPVRAEAEITSSLYNAAVSSGMPVDVLMQMIRAYSFDIDFQRDIRPGDRVEVLFEEMIDDDGQFVRGGSVLYARLDTRGRSLPIYRYETTDGEVDFFNEKGKSVRKTLMVTPIDGARLSSGYGMRRHPILGYSRMHRGLDFAAPTGTPIMAAGDGIVEYAGRKGNYGNYIRLRHPNEYHTVYAHMSRFASGIRRGARVKQGETIGYVGSTGMSTGPHLHYEVLHRGNHVNPATVDTPPGRILEGEELNLFLSAKKDLEVLFASLETREKLARMD